jgi:thioredoxin-dependent peroxiredoxin
MTGQLKFNQLISQKFSSSVIALYRVSTLNLVVISLVSCLCLNLFVTPVYALGGKLPDLNQPAPAFTLPTNTGNKAIALADLKGKWVVVYFYPKDFTSGCTLEARRFQEDLSKYLAINTQILGISADSVDSHAEFCDSEGLKFPLLADEDGAVSKAYGSWVGFLSMRHTFIIDPDGILQAQFTRVSPSIHSQQVLTKLRELQKSA